MSDTMESQGKSVEEAVAEALLRLGARRDEVEIEVLAEPRGGLLGILGARPARVRVTRRAGGEGRRGGERRGRGEGRDAPRARDRGEQEHAGGRPGERGRDRDRPREQGRDRAAGRTSAERPDERPAGAGAGGPGATGGAKDERPGTRRRGGRGRGRRGAAGRAPQDAPAGGAPPRPANEAPPPASERPVREAPSLETASTATIAGGATPPTRPTPPTLPTPPRPESDSGAEPLTAAGPAPTIDSARAVPAVSIAQPLRGIAPDEAPRAIERLASELMLRSGFPCRCEVRPGEYHSARVVTDETSAAILIGRHGGTIDAIEHLVERMASQAVGAHVNMNLDINNYRRRREEKLGQRARAAAELVRGGGEPIHFEPLSARERRIVHLEVAKTPELQTFTVQDEFGKHVVVAPAGMTPPAEASGGGEAEAPGWAGEPRENLGAPGEQELKQGGTDDGDRLSENGHGDA